VSAASRVTAVLYDGMFGGAAWAGDAPRPVVATSATTPAMPTVRRRIMLASRLPGDALRHPWQMGR
jgi:hypothetical protein